MTTALLDSEIRYSKTTRDYDILICGAIVASAPNFSQAELIRSQLLSERIQDGCYSAATELDGGAVPEGTDPDNFSDVPAGPGEPKRADSAVRRMMTFGHLRRDLFAPVLFCACGERATIVVYGDPDVYLCDRCHEPRTNPTGHNPIWRASALIGVADLHKLAQVDPAAFRARLAALSSADLRTQATLYAIYASMLCDREISAEETLEHFKLSIDVHRATVRSEDAVCAVLYELALTDAPAMIEFLRAHTDAQREQLAWRFAAWLERECEITREPTHILRGWQQLCVGAAACGADQLRIELADCLGFASGWDAVVALWRGADACAESYASL